MVICVVPVPVILESVTAMASIVELSEVFLMVILPLSTSTASLKLSTILASTATAVALSAGAEEDSVGLAISAVVKLSAVVLEMPAYELLEVSSKPLASINT